MKQVFSAIAYCHSNQVIHRNLRPEVIVFLSPESNEIRVRDFGMSQICIEGKKLNEISGNVYYVAPEILSGCYDSKSDIWSLGVILYILLSGEPPFDGDTNEEIHQKILEGKFSCS
mmetsp:Transcript_2416/g.2362  ORF Transcript_2416/g.2362 Transcript_2416/m.2362 type:complete len:116 (+) Transcript_2416:462-809(+)